MWPRSFSVPLWPTVGQTVLHVLVLRNYSSCKRGALMGLHLHWIDQFWEEKTRLFFASLKNFKCNGWYDFQGAKYSLFDCWSDFDSCFSFPPSHSIFEFGDYLWFFFQAGPNTMVRAYKTGRVDLEHCSVPNVNDHARSYNCIWLILWPNRVSHCIFVLGFHLLSYLIILFNTTRCAWIMCWNKFAQPFFSYYFI